MILNGKTVDLKRRYFCKRSFRKLRLKSTKGRCRSKYGNTR